MHICFHGCAHGILYMYLIMITCCNFSCYTVKRNVHLYNEPKELHHSSISIEVVRIALVTLYISYKRICFRPRLNLDSIPCLKRIQNSALSADQEMLTAFMLAFGSGRGLDLIHIYSSSIPTKKRVKDTVHHY